MILYKLLAGLFKGIRFIMPKPGSVLKDIGFIVVVLGFILNFCFYYYKELPWH